MRALSRTGPRERWRTHASGTTLSTSSTGEKPDLLEQRADLPFDVLKAFVRNGVASMPPFRKTEVTDADLAAIAVYLAESAKRTARAAPPRE